MMKSQDKININNDRPYFTWGGGAAIKFLLSQAMLIPTKRTNRAQLRRRAPEGDYNLFRNGEKLELSIVPMGFGDYTVYTDYLKPVYSSLKWAQKEVNKRNEKRDIIEPVLPEQTKQKIKSTVFDFFKAIDHFGTTRGFGNVGIILHGPAGVGKSETMRWLLKQ